MIKFSWLYISTSMPISSSSSMKSYAIALSNIKHQKAKLNLAVIKVKVTPKSLFEKMLVLEYPVLHTKFQGHKSVGPGEDEFKLLFTINWMTAMLVMWSTVSEQTFVPPTTGGTIWNWFTFTKEFPSRSHLNIFTEDTDGLQTRLTL